MPLAEFLTLFANGEVALDIEPYDLQFVDVCRILEDSGFKPWYSDYKNTFAYAVNKAKEYDTIRLIRYKEHKITAANSEHEIPHYRAAEIYGRDSDFLELLGAAP